MLLSIAVYGVLAMGIAGCAQEPTQSRERPDWMRSKQGSNGNGRVLKGKRMAGRYGAENVTTRNLEVVAVRAAEHLLLVRGAVPGARGGVVLMHHKPGARG